MGGTRRSDSKRRVRSDAGVSRPRPKDDEPQDVTGLGGVVDDAGVPEDIYAVLEELAPDTGTITLWKYGADRRLGFVRKFNVAEFNLNAITYEYGGGDYQARFHPPDGGTIRAKNFVITEPVRKIDPPPTPQAPPPPSPYGFESGRPAPSSDREMMYELVRMIREEVRARHPETTSGNPIEMATQIAAAMSGALSTGMSAAMNLMTERVKGGGQGVAGNMADIIEVVDWIMSKTGKGGEPAGDSDTVMLVQLGGEVLKLISDVRSGKVASNARPQISGQVDQPEVAPGPRTPWQQIMGPWVPQLIAWAGAQKDPEFYAGFVADNLPPAAESFLREKLGDRAFREQFYLSFPDAEPARWWLEKFMDALHEELNPEDDDAGTDA